jgi:hypothetical protein
VGPGIHAHQCGAGDGLYPQAENAAQALNREEAASRYSAVFIHSRIRLTSIRWNITTAVAWHRSTSRRVCETDQAGTGKLPLFPYINS